MYVLIACEESQRSCIAFRNRGFEAYSCDIQPCSGGHPEWHIEGDALKILNGGYFITADGLSHLYPNGIYLLHIRLAHICLMQALDGCIKMVS